MLQPTIADLLNRQVNREFYSAYLYLAISSHYDSQNLDGFAHWFMVQAQEERDHALLFYRYLHNSNVAVTLDAIEKPGKVFSDNLAPLTLTLEHEQYVTSLINTIYAAAYEAKDFRTMQFLDWFVKEQGEEEKNATDIIAKMKLYGDDAKALYLLNTELMARVYAPPTLVI